MLSLSFEQFFHSIKYQFVRVQYDLVISCCRSVLLLFSKDGIGTIVLGNRELYLCLVTGRDAFVVNVVQCLLVEVLSLAKPYFWIWNQVISNLVFLLGSCSVVVDYSVLATSLSVEEGLSLALTAGLALKELLVTDVVLGIKVGDLGGALLLEVAILVAIVASLVVNTTALSDNDAAIVGHESGLGLLFWRRFGAPGLIWPLLTNFYKHMC